MSVFAVSDLKKAGFGELRCSHRHLVSFWVYRSMGLRVVSFVLALLVHCPPAHPRISFPAKPYQADFPCSSRIIFSSDRIGATASPF